MLEPPAKPDWNRLYETAGLQDGHFTTQQGAAAGYSSQLLFKHIQAGRIVRVRHGVYRLMHFPAGDREELTVIWLWSERAGVFSHQTALLLHGLSDVLPPQIHLTLPSEWKRRRLRAPSGVVLHHGDVAPSDRAWSGAVPVTSPRRTLVDCAATHLAPDLLRQAAQQAVQRGLVARRDLVAIDDALAPFGGLAS